MERGFSVIIENMGETIDPIVLPVVTRAFIRRGNRNVILLGDDEVEQHPDFRLFLHTKLSNPHYPPEVQAETTIVNFMVTPTGLEDQLLAVVIKTERPDLAAHKAALLQQQNQFKACRSSSTSSVRWSSFILYEILMRPIFPKSPYRFTFGSSFLSLICCC